MTFVDLYRNALQALSLRPLGQRLANTRYVHLEQKSAFTLNELYTFPTVYAPQIQDLSPSSPTAGMPYFLVNASIVDGGNPIK